MHDIQQCTLMDLNFTEIKVADFVGLPKIAKLSPSKKFATRSSTKTNPLVSV